MFSKLSRLGTRLLCRGQNNSLGQLIRKRFSHGEEQIFVNETQFVKKDQMLVIYSSNEGRFFRVFSTLVGGFVIYNIYEYFTQQEQDEKDNSRTLASFFGVTFLLIQWKLTNTLKHVYLDHNGRTIFLDFFQYGGFSNKLIQTETLNMGGYSFFLHKWTKIPIFKYQYKGKKRLAYFKWSQASDVNILKNIFSRKTFIVGDNEIVSKISNTYKKKHL